MLKALADKTRWGLVRELLKKTRTVGQLSERMEVTQCNVSEDLRMVARVCVPVSSEDR